MGADGMTNRRTGKALFIGGSRGEEHKSKTTSAHAVEGPRKLQQSGNRQRKKPRRCGRRPTRFEGKISFDLSMQITHATNHELRNNRNMQPMGR